MTHERIESLFAWLVDGARGAKTSLDVIERTATDLRAANIPLDSVNAFVQTLHPQILGRAFRWRCDAPMQVGELTHALQSSPAFTNSPVAKVTTTNTEARHRILDGLAEDAFPVLHELARSGVTDYICLPLSFTNGEVHAISFSTKRASGFSDDDIGAIRYVVRPLARIAEILALQRVATNLLSTYVGHSAGEQILAGRIFKGDIETIRAVIWFSDLRGFTEMSSRSTPREIIDTLNELFECQVPPIEACGGEVLKFIGDGLLAIFPCKSEADTQKQCTSALEAARTAFASLDARNARAAAKIEFGLALHVGEIAYGNIGGASRLDFTAIGPAVNLAARLEGLTSKLGKRVVTSEDFAKHAPSFTVAGTFELKGVPAPQRVYTEDAHI